MSDNERDESGYSSRVGKRLRAIRKQKGLSLHEVEALSAGEFRASVVGAYERGERAISVPRLQRLAYLYAVPVDQLLPIDAVGPEEVIDLTAATGARPKRGVTHPLVLDLAALGAMSGPEADMLRRFVSMIQVERQDFNGRLLSVRHSDLRAIGAILGVSADSVPRRVRDLGLAYGDGSASAAG